MSRLQHEQAVARNAAIVAQEDREREAAKPPRSPVVVKSRKAEPRYVTEGVAARLVALTRREIVDELMLPIARQLEARLEALEARPQTATTGVRWAGIWESN